MVVVDEPSGANYYGSVVATPYAKLVFEGIIDYKNMEPNDKLESDLKKMEKTIIMPDLVGKSLSEAVGIITNLGLQYELDGDGGIVKTQYPAPTTMLYKNGIVVLST